MVMVKTICKEVLPWFPRLSLYEDYYKSRHEGKKPLKFLSLSTTRWLVVYLANSIIVNQYDDVRGFFNHVHNLPNFEKCYTAKSLAEMYNDKTNLLYLTFLDGILKDLHSLNLAFQKRDADITKLYSDLRVLLVALARRVFKPSFLKSMEPSDATPVMLHQGDLDAVGRALEKANEQFGCSLLPIDSMDFGLKFDKTVKQNPTISTIELKLVKERAAKFLISLCRELKDRLPQNISVIENIKYFSPLVCLSQAHIPVLNLPWDLAGQNSDEGNIESQWRHLQTLRLADISPDFDGSVHVTDFWIAVWKLKSANGERTFEDLAKFALQALSLPISNAGVERIFSFMAAIKTKIRNRMQMVMLVALVRIRMHMRVHKICCMSYEPTEDMIERFNKNMYQKNATENTETEDYSDLLEAFELFDLTAVNNDKEQ